MPEADPVVYSDQASAGLQRRRRGEARTYDFRRPVRLSREHAHALKVMVETFSRQTTTVMTTGLRVVCQLNPTGLDELSYDEYLGQLPEQGLCAVLSMEPLQGKALLTFDTLTLLTIIDHQLGGTGGEDQPERPLTEIEQALVRLQVNRMLRELAYAFEPIVAITPHLVGLEVNAGFVQAAAPTDPVVAATMDLIVGSHSSQLSLCLPFPMLAPALEHIASSSDAAEKARLREAAAARTQRRLTDVEVTVSVRFDPIRMTSGDIVDLQVGDVITLGHRTSRPLSVTSASTTFARAVPGSSGKRLAVLVVDPQGSPPAASGPGRELPMTAMPASYEGIR